MDLRMLKRASVAAGLELKAAPGYMLRHAGGYAITNQRRDTRTIQGSSVDRFGVACRHSCSQQKAPPVKEGSFGDGTLHVASVRGPTRSVGRLFPDFR